MISKTMEDAINKQINRELYSAYLYLGMSAYCESANLKGFAKWLRVQAKEEQGHALKFYDFIIARAVKSRLALLKPQKQSGRRQEKSLRKYMPTSRKLPV